MISPRQITSDGHLRIGIRNTALVLAVFGWLGYFGDVIPNIEGSCRVMDEANATATLADSTNASISDRANATAELTDQLEP